MKPIFNYIISTTERYKNKVDVEGKELIVNTEITERDAEFVNRIGLVLETPLYNELPIEKGDQVIVHHNVFRRWFDQHGAERNSSSYLDSNRYGVYHDQIFAYKRDDEWISLPNYVFLAPVENDDKWSTNIEKPMVGKVVYSNDLVEIGDIVGFTPESEYEFNIEGQKTYRVISNQITWTQKKEESKSSSLVT